MIKLKGMIIFKTRDQNISPIRRERELRLPPILKGWKRGTIALMPKKREKLEIKDGTG